MCAAIITQFSLTIVTATEPEFEGHNNGATPCALARIARLRAPRAGLTSAPKSCAARPFSIRPCHTQTADPRGSLALVGVTRKQPLLNHAQHLIHVAARVDEIHARDDQRLGVHRELRIERRAEAAVGYLRHTRVVIGGAPARLLGLLGFLGVFGLFLGGLLARALIFHHRLGSSCLVSGRVRWGGLGLPLLALARQALVDLLHYLEGALAALFALCAGTPARRTHAPSAGTRAVTNGTDARTRTCT